jgi:enoyl-CoA hydratase/carnithine racemase
MQTDTFPGLVCSEQLLTSRHTIGWCRLDSPRTLNSLTLDMVHSLQIQLSKWAHRADVVCVVLSGEGRAFCAGGDVRQMRQGILDGTDYCDRFFEAEYRLDHGLHTYPKPLLCWGHGVVMGGGIGLLVGASHRVVTPSTRMAMPEVNIGLYPDVGASWFLNRLPAGLGLFLGITACEFNGADAVGLGLADVLVEDSAYAQLETLLAGVTWTGNAVADSAHMKNVLQQLPLPTVEASLLPYAEKIAATCDGTLDQALNGLQKLDIDQAWFTHALDTLAVGCPVTMRLIEEQLRRGKGMSLVDAFCQEWIMSVQCARHPDFPEGVRAQLVDKDRKPRWSYKAACDVPAALVEAHFLNPLAENPLSDLA